MVTRFTAHAQFPGKCHARVLYKGNRSEKSNFWPKNGHFKKICGWMCYFIEYLWKEGLIRCLKQQTGLINIILSWEKRKGHTRRTVKTATKNIGSPLKAVV